MRPRYLLLDFENVQPKSLPALVGPAAVMSASERLAAVVDNLRFPGNARPRKRQTLFGTIHAHFQKTLSESEVDALIDALVREGHITLNGDAVTYSLPAG